MFEGIKVSAVNDAAEIIAVMDGYPCAGEPLRFHVGRDGDPTPGCKGRPDCEDHCYREFPIPALPAALTVGPWAIPEQNHLAAFMWLWVANRREGENEARLLVLMRSVLLLRKERAMERGERQRIDALGQEIARFLADRWGVQTVPETHMEVEALAKRRSRAAEITDDWREWKPKEPMLKARFLQAMRAQR